MSLTWKDLKRILDEAKEPNSATKNLQKIGDQIAAAFSPEKMKEMDDRIKSYRENDPKFQEWKKNREAFRAKVKANYDPVKHMEWAKEQDKNRGWTSDHPKSFTRWVGKPDMFGEDYINEVDLMKSANRPPSLFQKVKDDNRSSLSVDSVNADDARRKQDEADKKKKDDELKARQKQTSVETSGSTLLSKGTK